MTTSYWLRPHRFGTPDITADLVIVGAGASGRNAGFLTKGSATLYKSLTTKWGVPRTHEIYKFAEDSLNLIFDNILKKNSEIQFEKTTSLTLFQNEADVFKSEEFHFEWKTGTQFPSSIQSNYFGAYENGPEFKIDPMQLLLELKKKRQARKVQIIEGLSGFELTSDGVSTESNRIKCKQVVLALNGYFSQFHPAFNNLINPKRAQMLSVELENEIDSNSLHYDSRERVYWRKSFEKVSTKIQAGLESYLKDTLNLCYKVLGRWSGTMGFTDHELPFITRAEAPLDTYVIGGFSWHGVGLGFRSAQEMAMLVTGQISQSFFDKFKMVKIKL